MLVTFHENSSPMYVRCMPGLVDPSLVLDGWISRRHAGYFSPQPLHEYDAISADLNKAESALFVDSIDSGEEGGANVHLKGSGKKWSPSGPWLALHVLFIL